uniref:Tagaturonate/fructuronate epimerase n=1 Tax=Ignisphaera aggregans TaxID=334771 RepID=A0A7J2U4Z0_9CREN
MGTSPISQHFPSLDSHTVFCFTFQKNTRLKIFKFFSTDSSVEVLMYLGKLPRPAFGVRIPDIVIPPILKAFKSLGIAGTLMLSFNRETAPSSYINSTNPDLLYFGHTGTSIEEYITKGRRFGEAFGAVIEIEADHVSIMGSVERALKKIAGVPMTKPISDDEIATSLSYIEEEFSEVKKSGGVDFVTIDTCELIDYSIDTLSDREVVEFYENNVEFDERREMEERYLEKTFTFISSDRQLTLRFSRPTLARLVLKYRKSLEYVKKVLDIVMKYNDKPFGIEIAFDETPKVSPPNEVFFYVYELKRMGIEPDFLAPNIGFRKREDYNGDLRELYENLRNIHTILYSNNVLISIHSGSGHNPYSDKGFGVWSVVGEALRGMVKYKMSGVLIQLLLETMSRFPKGSATRRLYEEIYYDVIEHLRKVVSLKLALYSPELENLLKTYEKCVTCCSDPRTDIFRHYFYVFQVLRDEKGKRYLRERLVEHYMENRDLQKVYEGEVYLLIERLAKAMRYRNNVFRYRNIAP